MFLKEVVYKFYGSKINYSFYTRNYTTVLTICDDYSTRNTLLGCIGMSLENLPKLNFGSPMHPGEGGDSLGANGESLPQPYGTHSNLKRRRTDEYEDVGIFSAGKCGSLIYPETRSLHTAVRTFLSIRHNPFVYHTEDWKPRGCTMYLPLTEDIMINTRNIEQISFEMDQFFLADEKGNYVGAKSGNAIHLWRYDPSSRKLYISRSVLFLKEQDYREVQLQLEAL